MSASLEEKIKTFLRLILLNILTVGTSQPLFQILSGKTPFSGELVFATFILMDERLLDTSLIIGSILGLLIIEDAFSLFKKVWTIIKPLMKVRGRES
jgi:hypothetical protein